MKQAVQVKSCCAEALLLKRIHPCVAGKKNTRSGRVKRMSAHGGQKKAPGEGREG